MSGAPVMLLQPGFGEEPCALCGVQTLPDFLEDVGELLMRGRKCCAECTALLEAERGYEQEQRGPLHEIEGWS